MLWDNLSALVENDYIDFKREYYTKDKLGEVDMVHDILCMSNSLTDSSDRYIIIGIEEDKPTKEKIIHDVSSDNNCRQSADVIQTLRNYMSVIPNIELIREQTECGFIDIIKIMPVARELSYVLNKECQAQKPDGKKVTVRKEWIYSRNSDRNTPKDECCTKAELEELFARKRGEHLPILERFSMHLEDIENWKRPKRSLNHRVSEDAYYFTKNHKFKIVRQDSIENNLKSVLKVIDYGQLLFDTSLNQDYWDYRINGGACYDDCYETFNVELWADNTLIEVIEVTQIYLKYYLYDKGLSKTQSFYIPSTESLLNLPQCESKEDIKKSLAWKICQLIQYEEIKKYGDVTLKETECILDLLNYEYLSSNHFYITANKETLFKTVL